MNKYTLIIAFLFSISIAFVNAQTPVENESFKYTLHLNKNGAEILYTGKNHSFSLDLEGKSIKDAAVGNLATNQNSIYLDKNVIATSWVPLQLPLPAGYDLGNLSAEQQMEILNDYANYEFDYFKQDLQVKAFNLVKEFTVINSRPFLIWYFNQKPYSNKKSYTGQVYISTICFNQTLSINLPMYASGGFINGKELLTKIASTLKTYNTRFTVK